MSRPPIIISNGGIVEELALNCGNLNSDAAVATEIMVNVKRITEAAPHEDPLSEVVVIKKGNPRTPCLFWRKFGTNTQPLGPGRSGAKINTFVDEQDD